MSVTLVNLPNKDDWWEELQLAWSDELLSQLSALLSLLILSLFRGLLAQFPPSGIVRLARGNLVLYKVCVYFIATMESYCSWMPSH